MIQFCLCLVVMLGQFVPNSTSRAIQDQPKKGAETPAADVIPAGFFLNKEPAGSKFVEDVKTAAKAGDKVVVRGRIGGSATPFVEGRAVFTIVGSGLKACSDKPGDQCKQPWDYCCDPPDVIAKHTATIQVLGSSNAPLKVGLKGQNNLKELSDVIVEGTVKYVKESVFIVNATAIYVVKP